jgi:hypothetical protein
MSLDLTEPHIVCHLHTQRCMYCNASQLYSHVYVCETVGRVKKLKPLGSPAEAAYLPAILTEMPLKTVPYCHLCLAGRPMLSAEAHSRWQQTLARKKIEARGETATPSAKPTATIDDLD